jgi:UPF0755 protein
MSLVRRFGVVIVLGACALGLGAYRLGRPYAGFTGETFVEIPRGLGTGGIADLLEHEGVIASRWDFVTARVLERGRKLQAGEYRFKEAASAIEVYNRIARGDTFYYPLVVTEGQNLYDIGAAVGELGRFPAKDFLLAARNPALIRDLDPQAPTLEGYLFPSTYRLGRHATPEKLCQMMTARFRETWHRIGTKASVHDTVTLASLVEKEDKLASERPIIAAVFTNRLRIGMKLDCDPTTIYAALRHGRYRGTIYRSDLDSDDAYNTYQHTGLPPGPIANPGEASLRAALAPADSDALFFVAKPDGSGGHVFHHDLAGHQASVAEYRRGNHP